MMVYQGGIEQDRLILSAAPYCPTVLAIEFRAKHLPHIPRFQANPSHRIGWRASSTTPTRGVLEGNAR
ncbi:MAG: hypothetical protein LW720_14685 [Pirellula sp.]|nr:hypothetical protein [Pirellula sp.]